MYKNKYMNSNNRQYKFEEEMDNSSDSFDSSEEDSESYYTDDMNPSIRKKQRKNTDRINYGSVNKIGNGSDGSSDLPQLKRSNACYGSDLKNKIINVQTISYYDWSTTETDTINLNTLKSITGNDGDMMCSKPAQRGYMTLI